MATTYPYISSAGPLLKTIEQLRKSFPSEVSAETLQKLGLAPKNESYVINALRFIGVIDENSKKISSASKAFLSDDSGFAKHFEPLVKQAYKELFDLYGDEAWKKSVSDLTTFFRQSDESSSVVGKRQANTFRAFASLSGHGEKPQISDRQPSTGKKIQKKTSKRSQTETSVKAMESQLQSSSSDVGLTVRIEINLPAIDNQDIYDKIFKSIRENFIDKR